MGSKELKKVELQAVRAQEFSVKVKEKSCVHP
jgi:hypothetical protein